MASGQATDLIGKLVGRYRIEKRLGSGGMGEVYLARQVEIGSRVAIKVMSSGATTDSEGAKRMFAEARAVNLVQHDRIVNVLDMTRIEGRPALIMEHLRGVSLDRLLGGGPIPSRPLAEISIDILDALAAVHAQEIFHRDLKPGNVFVSPEGRATLLDFGLAKMADDLLGTVIKTQAGMVMGTVPYMAPEQARGEPFTAASDIFAVGVLLYEGATSQRPFRGQSIFELLKEHDAGAQPPRSLNPALDPGLEAIIMRALAINSADRYSDAKAMQNALSEIVSGLEPASLRARIDRFHKRSRAFVGVQPEFSGAETIKAGSEKRRPPRVSSSSFAIPVDTVRNRWLVAALAVATCAFLATAVLAMHWRSQIGEKGERSRSPAAVPTAVKGVAPIAPKSDPLPSLSDLELKEAPAALPPAARTPPPRPQADASPKSPFAEPKSPFAETKRPKLALPPKPTPTSDIVNPFE